MEFGVRIMQKGGRRWQVAGCRSNRKKDKKVSEFTEVT